VTEFVIYNEDYEIRGWPDGRDTFARVGDNENVSVVFMGILEGKGSLGRRGRRWKDNIEKDIKELGWKDVNAVHLARDRDQ
jgi:hypothetical protein